jgi:hypothetical protein
MNMKLGIITLAILGSTLVGCATNPALQAQVDQLQREATRQQAETKDLADRAARLAAQCAGNDIKEATEDLAIASWDWAKVYASQTANLMQTVIACYNKSKGDRTLSWEDTQHLLTSCYQNSTKH